MFFFFSVINVFPCFYRTQMLRLTVIYWPSLQLLGWFVAAPIILAILYVMFLPIFTILVRKFSAGPSSPKAPLLALTDVNVKVRDVWLTLQLSNVLSTTLVWSKCRCAWHCLYIEIYRIWSSFKLSKHVKPNVVIMWCYGKYERNKNICLMVIPMKHWYSSICSSF